VAASDHRDRSLSQRACDSVEDSVEVYRLKTFPIYVLKIDQSFVRDLVSDSDDAQITGATIGLAHNLRLEVVAEGVETEKQLAFLRARGCDLAQGFYLGRPQSANDLTGLLREKRETVPGVS
jgi:EAL domain-containing protein (putative c-di-GMP-specific phosphodiesterase class I)